MKTIDMDDITPPGEPHGKGPRRMSGGSGGGGVNFPGGKSLLTFGMIAFAFLAVVILYTSGNLGMVRIADDQVAVKMNYITGKREVITTPGFKLYIPFLQDIFPMDQTPQKYLMEGKVSKGDNHAPFLTVRASDGSNFWFESMEIQYRLIVSKSGEVLDDSGPGDGFKRDWIRAYARSVLRDEFGRISAVEVANPSSYEAAAMRSTERMNDVLRDHGVQIMRLITPKPRFDRDYELAIEEKKVADQKVDHLKVKEEQLLQQREQQLAQVAKEKEIQWQELQGELRKELLNSEKEAIFITKGADRYAVTREAQGQQERDKFSAEAEGLVAKYTAEAEGIRARTKALEKQGRVVVREALIQKLASIQFTLIPYNRDPSPTRLEHEGSATATEKSATQNQGGN